MSDANLLLVPFDFGSKKMFDAVYKHYAAVFV